MNKNKVTFILHKPQLSENIGACARALKNFNFQKLYLIDPKPFFPNIFFVRPSEMISILTSGYTSFFILYYTISFNLSKNNCLLKDNCCVTTPALSEVLKVGSFFPCLK